MRFWPKRKRKHLPDAMDSRLRNAHWFWLTILIFLTQAQLFYFLPLAVAGLGIAITVLRALSLYFVAHSSAVVATGGRRAEQLMDEAQAKYGKKKPPFRWSVWLSLGLAIIALITVFQSYGHLVYRDASVGLLFILIAIKYAESVTRRDAMLLVCLASFLLITTFFYTQSPLALFSSLLVFFALGGTLDALFQPEPTLEIKHIRTTLKRFGVLVLQGIPIALVLFFLFPRLSAPLWGIPHGTLTQTGLSDSMSPGEIAELTVSDAIAFRVEFDGVPPPNRLRYWRGPVFAIFDGISWRPGPTYFPFDQEFFSEREQASAIDYTVTLEPHDRGWLFALELPYGLPERESGSFEQRQRRFAYKNYAQQLLSVAPVTQTVRYRQKSILRNHFPADPREKEFNLRVPVDKNPQTYTLAHTLRTPGMSDQDYADTVLEYFRREPFYYSLSFDNLEMDPQNPVDGFLFGTKTGFCEHYASAFVVLMRVGGVPARVVTGYQGGEMNPQGNYMIVRQADAHAWAEVLIDGEWRRVDPTAAVAPERVELGLGASLSGSDAVPRMARTDADWLKNAALYWDALKYSWARYVIEFDYQRQRNLWSRMNFDEQLWRIALIAASIIVFWIALLLIVLSWRARRRDPVQAAWEKLCDKLARADLPRMPCEGAQTFLERASKRWPQYQPIFAQIGRTYTVLRYGQPNEKEQPTLLHSLRQKIDAFPSARSLKRLPQRTNH